MLCIANVVVFSGVNTIYLSTVWVECTNLIVQLVGYNRTEHRHSLGQNVGMRMKLCIVVVVLCVLL